MTLPASEAKLRVVEAIHDHQLGAKDADYHVAGCVGKNTRHFSELMANQPR